MVKLWWGQVQVDLVEHRPGGQRVVNVPRLVPLLVLLYSLESQLLISPVYKSASQCLLAGHIGDDETDDPSSHKSNHVPGQHGKAPTGVGDEVTKPAFSD